ncbi:MAG: hypothetical protein WD042_10115 [Phycisphaeraceae bacterium]
MQVIDDPTFATFGQDGSRWEIEAHKGVGFTGRNEDDMMVFDVAEAQGANWHGEFRFAPFAVRESQRATIRFEAKSQIPINFSVWIGKYRSPWSQLVTDATHFRQKQMTQRWTTFQHTAIISADDDEARLNFVFGVSDNRIWLKGISLILEA